MNEPYQWAVASPAQEAKPERKPWAVVPVRLVASASVFGALFSYLLVKQEPGLNFTLLVLLAYVFAFINRGLFVVRTFKQEWPIYIATVPVIVLSILFFTSDTMLNALSVLIIVFVMMAQYVVISGNAVYSWDHPGFILDLFFGALNRGLLAMGLYSVGLFGSLFKGCSKKRKGVLAGVGAGVVLLIIIVPLLALSDSNVSSILLLLFRGLNFGDIFLYIFIFYLGATLITAPVASSKGPELTGLRQTRERSESRPVQTVTVGIALTMLGFIYVLFALVQFQYFFMPYETLGRVLGLTSSEYAVRGFGELLLVTCINFAVILLAQRFTMLKDGRMSSYLKGLFTLLVAFNFVIMASSHLRMQCYELSYGHTVLRFLSHSFMVLLMVLNAIILIKIFRPQLKTAKLFMATTLLYFCVITTINPERYVARGNIARYEQAIALGENEDIDVNYLFGLSDSALPSVCAFLERHPEMLTEDIRDEAASRLDYLRSGSGGWQSLNTAHVRAQSSLEHLLRA